MGTIYGEVATAVFPVSGTTAKANIGVAFIVGGILGCIPFGIWVGKTQ